MLRTQGLIAPLVLDGPINGRAFRAWVEQALAPTLGVGDIAIMANLSSHKVTGVREAIEARGAKLRYLPPYSPDYNPIEPVVATLKTLLRKTAARTVDTLWSAIGSQLDRFTANASTISCTAAMAGQDEKALATRSSTLFSDGIMFQAFQPANKVENPFLCLMLDIAAGCCYPIERSGSPAVRHSNGSCTRSNTHVHAQTA